MLIALAYAGDERARQLVERWSRSTAASLLVPRDLSSPGWQHRVGEAGEDFLVCSGERVRARDVRGVVTLRYAILPEELPHIVAEDRGYVAAEMNALLIAWLDGLRCPILNRPSARSLAGPVLTRERWLVLAARVGLPLASRTAHVPAPACFAELSSVTVIGDRWFGDVAPSLGERAVLLCKEARARALTVCFQHLESARVFAGAEPVVDAACDDVADALLAELQGGAPP